MKSYHFAPPVMSLGFLADWESIGETTPSSFIEAPQAIENLVAFVEGKSPSSLPILCAACEAFAEVVEPMDLILVRLMKHAALPSRAAALEWCLRYGFPSLPQPLDGECRRRFIAMETVARRDLPNIPALLANYPDAPSWERDLLYDVFDDFRCAALPSPLAPVPYDRAWLALLREPHLEKLLAPLQEEDADSKLGVLAKNYRKVFDSLGDDRENSWIALSMIEIGAHVSRGKKDSSLLKSIIWFRLAEALNHPQAGIYLSDVLTKMETGKEFREGFRQLSRPLAVITMELLEKSFRLAGSSESWGRTKAQAGARLAVMLVSSDGVRAIALLDESKEVKCKELPADVAWAYGEIRTGVPEGTVLVVHDFPDGPDKELPKYERLKTPIRLGKVESPDAIGVAMVAEFPWMEAVTNHVVASLHLLRHAGRPLAYFPSVLLVGSPGIGKTRYCTRLAELLGLPYRVLPSSRTQDAHIMSGMSRGWKDAQPSFLTQWMSNDRVGNPMVILDELDKASERGQLGDALYMLLEPSTARKYHDNFIGAACDFGWVNWMATANKTLFIPSVLKSRFAVFEVEDPAPAHYPLLLQRARLDLADRLRVKEDALPPLGDDELVVLRPFFTSPRAAIAAMQNLLGRLAADRNKMH